MNLALILILLGLGIFVGIIAIVYKTIGDKIPDVLGGFLVFILFVIIFCSGLNIYNQYEESILELEENHEFYIYSLGNDKYINGDIGLFSGTIDEIDYYFFYVKYTNGMFREKLKLDKCYIVEGDYPRPEIKGVYRKFKDKDKFWKIWDDVTADYYKIYVPKGTIIRNFKVR